jgi:hypothetical protein
MDTNLEKLDPLVLGPFDDQAEMLGLQASARRPAESQWLLGRSWI